MRRTFAVLTLSLACYGQSSEAKHWADHWADEYGVERELVYAVIEAESAWNPHAISTAGAVGLMQLMPETAATFGVRNRFDARENIRGGVAYLVWLREQCGEDLRLILASYNAGPKHVLAQRLRYSVAEVNEYVRRVAHLYRRNRWETILREGGTL